MTLVTPASHSEQAWWRFPAAWWMAALSLAFAGGWLVTGRALPQGCLIWKKGGPAVTVFVPLRPDEGVRIALVRAFGQAGHAPHAAVRDDTPSPVLQSLDFQLRPRFRQRHVRTFGEALAAVVAGRCLELLERVRFLETYLRVLPGFLDAIQCERHVVRPFQEARRCGISCFRWRFRYR